MLAGASFGTYPPIRDKASKVARAHRGAAFADFNGDGKVDVVVTSLSETTELWQNVSPILTTGLFLSS